MDYENTFHHFPQESGEKWKNPGSNAQCLGGISVCFNCPPLSRAKTNFQLWRTFSAITGCIHAEPTAFSSVLKRTWLKKMQGGVERPFADQFHREKASPALLASIGEWTVFIINNAHAVQSVLQIMGLLRKVWFCCGQLGLPQCNVEA